MLVYGLKGDRKNIFERVSDERQFGIRYIEDHELDKKVHELLDGQTHEVPSDFVMDKDLGDDFEYVLFVNIKDDDLYGFIKDLKEEGIYIPHKAILTKMNVNWPLIFLMNENKEEHKVMTLFGRLRNLMQMGAQAYEETGDEELKNLLIESEEYFHPREFEIEELSEVYNKLAIKLNKLKAEKNGEQYGD